MIPRVIPPLTGLYALVTRPQPQCNTFAAAIDSLGGHASVFPTVTIERIEHPPFDCADLVIFVSAHAVEHGLPSLRRSSATRIAAIGKATAAALAAGGAPADIVPEVGFTSEALLAHPLLNLVAGLKVQIVRGLGGREVLQQELLRHAVIVETLEVYRRVRTMPDPGQLAALEQQWREVGFDVVTATSVETLDNLLQMLTEPSRLLLRTTPLLVVSQRIAAAAVAMGLQGECVLAQPDEHSMLGALAVWRTRARNYGR